MIHKGRYIGEVGSRRREFLCLQDPLWKSQWVPVYLWTWLLLAGDGHFQASCSSLAKGYKTKQCHLRSLLLLTLTKFTWPKLNSWSHPPSWHVGIFLRLFSHTTVAFLVSPVKGNCSCSEAYRGSSNHLVDATAFRVHLCCLGLAHPLGLCSSQPQAEAEVGFLETDWEQLVAPITSSAPHLDVGIVFFLIWF